MQALAAPPPLQVPPAGLTTRLDPNADVAPLVVPLVRPGTFRAVSASRQGRPETASRKKALPYQPPALSPGSPSQVRQLRERVIGDALGEVPLEVAYLSSHVSRPVVSVHPDDLPPSLNAFARRDLLSSAVRRVGRAGDSVAAAVSPNSKFSVTANEARLAAEVARSVTGWQLVSRENLHAARLSRDPAIRDLVSEMENGRSAVDLRTLDFLSGKAIPVPPPQQQEQQQQQQQALQKAAPAPAPAPAPSSAGLTRQQREREAKEREAREKAEKEQAALPTSPIRQPARPFDAAKRARAALGGRDTRLGPDDPEHAGNLDAGYAEAQTAPGLGAGLFGPPTLAYAFQDATISKDGDAGDSAFGSGGALPRSPIKGGFKLIARGGGRPVTASAYLSVANTSGIAPAPNAVYPSYHYNRPGTAGGRSAMNLARAAQFGEEPRPTGLPDSSPSGTGSLVLEEGSSIENVNTLGSPTQPTMMVNNNNNRPASGRPQSAAANFTGNTSAAARYLVRRQVEVLSARNQTEVEKALMDWKAAKAQLDRDIDSRILSRQRPKSANVLTSMDYSGSIKASIEQNAAHIARHGNRKIALQGDTIRTAEEDEVELFRKDHSRSPVRRLPNGSAMVPSGAAGIAMGATPRVGANHPDADAEDASDSKRIDDEEGDASKPASARAGKGGRQPEGAQVAPGVFLSPKEMLAVRGVGSHAGGVGPSAAAGPIAPPRVAMPVVIPAGAVLYSQQPGLQQPGGQGHHDHSLPARPSTTPAGGSRGNRGVSFSVPDSGFGSTSGSGSQFVPRGETLLNWWQQARPESASGSPTSRPGTSGGSRNSVSAAFDPQTAPPPASSAAASTAPAAVKAAVVKERLTAVTQGSENAPGQQRFTAGQPLQSSGLARVPLHSRVLGNKPLEVLERVSEIRSRLEASGKGEIGRLKDKAQQHHARLLAAHARGKKARNAVDGGDEGEEDDELDEFAELVSSDEAKAAAAAAGLPDKPTALEVPGGLKMELTSIETALMPTPSMPPTIKKVADGLIPVVSAPPKPKAAAANAKGGKPPAKAAAAADPAAPSFPGVGLGLITGESRPFSAAAGGGASFFGYPENPALVAERMKAIRDEVFGVGKKKPAAKKK